MELLREVFILPKKKKGIMKGGWNLCRRFLYDGRWNLVTGNRGSQNKWLSHTVFPLFLTLYGGGTLGPRGNYILFPD